MGDKRPLSSTATASSRHSEASALVPSEAGDNALYKRQTDEELAVLASQTVYMQILSNRDLATALRYDINESCPICE